MHADLFRDNVMFDAGALSGFFDFYFAGVDSFAFDLAVCLNDWCIDHATGHQDDGKTAAMREAYESVRPLTAAERELMPASHARRRLALLDLAPVGLAPAARGQHAASRTTDHFERVLRARLEQL